MKKKTIQFNVAFHINALSYMRITARITDKHDKSHFVLIVMEIADSQHFRNLLVFLDYLTFYTPQKMN